METLTTIIGSKSRFQLGANARQNIFTMDRQNQVKEVKKFPIEQPVWTANLNVLCY